MLIALVRTLCIQTAFGLGDSNNNGAKTFSEINYLCKFNHINDETSYIPKEI